VRWDKACLSHPPPLSLCIYTSIISVTVISLMGARVRFKRTVSASLCLETQGYQLVRLMPVISPPPKVETIMKSLITFNDLADLAGRTNTRMGNTARGGRGYGR
jgi:hypothetical protein